MFDNMYFHITVEIIGGLVGLLISVKIIGKRQMSQISPFDFVSAVVLGEVLGSAIYDKNITLLQISYALFLWTLLLFIIEKVTQKFPASRRFIQSAPSFVISNGELNYKSIKGDGLDIEELLSLLRQKDIFSIREVEYCIFEPGGNISVVKSSLSGKTILSLPVVIEGKIIEDNLQHTPHDKKWLLNKLDAMNVGELNEILYAEWNIYDDIHIQFIKNDNNR